MNISVALLLFLAAIGFAITFRVLAGSMDGGRVSEYVRRQGGQLLDQRWSPFGKGWFGEKNDRIYEIRYRDRDGNIREATVKTSLFSGVYMTSDQIIQAAAPKDNNDLEAENLRLRQRLAELERKAPDR